MRKNKTYIGMLEIWNQDILCRLPADMIWKPDMLMYNRSHFRTQNIFKDQFRKKFLFFFSADEKFDGSFPTNVIVSDTGLCSYLPPGIFKVFFSLVEPHCWPLGMKFVILRSHLFQTSSISVNMQDWHHLVSIWRAELRHEVWQLDLRWI